MADYTFTIRTPAELQGVEKAIERFERLRGQAQANGKDFAALDEKIARAKASIESYNQVQAQAGQTAAKATTDQTNLADSHRRATDAADKHEVSERKLDKAFGALASAGGPLARAANLIRELAGSPLTIGLALGSLAVSAITEKFRAWREEIETTKARLEQIEWSKFNSIVTGLKNATIELNNFNRELRKAGQPDDELKQFFDERIAVIEAEIEKKKVLLKVNEQLEVSELKGRTEKQLSEAENITNDKARKAVQDAIRNKSEKAENQIRSRYASFRAGLDTDADRKSLQELENELALRAGNAPGLRTTAEGTKRIALGEKSSPIAAEVNAMVEQLGGKDGLVEQLRTKAIKAQEAADSWSVFDVLDSLSAGNRYFERSRIKRATEAQSKLEDAAAQLNYWQNLQTSLQANQSDLDATAGDAFSKFEQNEGAMTLLRREISKRRRVDPIKASGRAIESMTGLQEGPESEQFLSAVAGAHNIQSGERATPDQSAALNRVAQVHGFSGANTGQLLKLLDGLFQNQEKLAAALPAYLHRVEQLERNLNDTNSKLRDSYNQ